MRPRTVCRAISITKSASLPNTCHINLQWILPASNILKAYARNLVYNLELMGYFCTAK